MRKDKITSACLFFLKKYCQLGLYLEGEGREGEDEGEGVLDGEALLVIEFRKEIPMAARS